MTLAILYRFLAHQPQSSGTLDTVPNDAPTLVPRLTSDQIPPEASSRPGIADYGIIGDCRSAALISLTGSIDWLCWPRFDKPSIFAALLDPQRGGCWSISPTSRYR